MQNLGFDISGAGAFLSTKLWLLQRAFNWQLMMPSDFNGVFGYLVSQYCQDIQFGDYRISELSTRKHGAFQRFYAGVQEIESVDLIFVVPADNSVMDYFYGWYNKMIDHKGYYYPKLNYRRDVYILLYGKPGVESIKFKLMGTFPKTHPKIHPSYAADDVLRAHITLSVDKVVPSSLIGSVRRGAMNLLGDVADKVGSMFGTADK